MFKKVIKIILLIVLGVLCFGTLSGCKFAKYYPEYESGFYRYAVETKKDGTKRAYLIGLTESGAQQKELIYPETIDGIPVYGISYDAGIMPGKYIVGQLKSECLEKLFLTIPIKGTITNNGEVIKFKDTTRVVYWSLRDRGHRITEIKGAIFGYNYIEEERGLEKENAYIANVSYRYNYDNTPNNGYYWVDSYDESVITFIPPSPAREGYQFGGWYKENECINAWNFETDVTGKEIAINGRDLIYYNKPKYYGINLYAKWIKV